MFELLPPLKQRFFDSNGAPLVGGKLFSYIAGTTTPSGTFADSGGVTPNTNPIILDANGYANVWIAVGGGAYKFVLEDSLGDVLWTVDNVTLSAASVPSGWTIFNITDGESPTNLTGITVDLSSYSSALYNVEIKRGTTVISVGQIAIQNLNGTGRVVTGLFMANEQHGVTFSVSQVGTVVQLKAATSSGPGAGTIKLSGILVPA